MYRRLLELSEYERRPVELRLAEIAWPVTHLGLRVVGWVCEVPDELPLAAGHNRKGHGRRIDQGQHRYPIPLGAGERQEGALRSSKHSQPVSAGWDGRPEPI